MRTTSAREKRGKTGSTEQNEVGLALPCSQDNNGPLSGDERLARAAAWFAWEAHPGQRKLLTLSLPDGTEPQTLVAACGRRWGKTEALAADIVVRFLTEPDLCQMLVGPTRDQATLLFECVAEKLEGFAAFRAAKPSWEIRRSPYPHIRRVDGAIPLSCHTAGRDGRNLRGRGATRRMPRLRIVVDEAAFVSDEAINEALRPMLATVPGGGQLALISSPNGQRGAFFEAYLRGTREEKEGGRTRAMRCPTSDNPLVDAVYLEEMRHELTERAFQAEFLAEFVDPAGAIFPEEEIRAALCDDDYGDAPLMGVRYAAGVDFGRRGDYTVCIVVSVMAGEMRVVEVTRLKGIGYGVQAAKMSDCLQKWGVRLVCADATGVGDAATEELTSELLKRRARCEVEGVFFTSATKTGLMDSLSLSLSAHRLRFPPHPDLISELRRFAVVGLTPTGRERQEALSGHDDCVCALALAVYAAKAVGVGRKGAIGAAGGGRIYNESPLGDKRGMEEFSVCKSERLDMTNMATMREDSSPEFGGRSGETASVMTRFLATAYRCAAGRRAGAFLRRLFPK